MHIQEKVLRESQMKRIALLKKTLLEKVRIVEALQDFEKRYRQLFESAKEGILILDADTGKVAMSILSC